MKKVLISCFLTVIIFSVLSFVIAEVSTISVDTPTCDEFKSQPQAQDAFSSDPYEFAALARDPNGRVCNFLPSEPEPEPTKASVTVQIDHLMCGSIHQSLVDWIFHRIGKMDDDTEAATLLANLAAKERTLNCRPPQVVHLVVTRDNFM